MTAAACPQPMKKRYATRDAAQSKGLRHSRSFGKPFRAYKCPCGFWHLTTSPDHSHKETTT